MEEVDSRRKEAVSWPNILWDLPFFTLLPLSIVTNNKVNRLNANRKPETCKGSVCFVRGYMNGGIKEKLQGTRSWVMKKICYRMIFVHALPANLWVSKSVTWRKNSKARNFIFHFPLIFIRKDVGSGEIHHFLSDWVRFLLHQCQIWVIYSATN